jgi:hypothetical protein
VKALAVVLSVLTVLAHPVAAAVVFATVLAVCGAGAWLAWRALRRRPGPSPHWRRA